MCQVAPDLPHQGIPAGETSLLAGAASTYVQLEGLHSVCTIRTATWQCWGMQQRALELSHVQSFLLLCPCVCKVLDGRPATVALSALDQQLRVKQHTTVLATITNWQLAHPEHSTYFQFCLRYVCVAAVWLCCVWSMQWDIIAGISVGFMVVPQGMS